MPEYVYLAIFTPEKNGYFSIVFPDVKGCVTQGKSIIDAMEMAEDALALMLCSFEVEDCLSPI